MNLWSNYVKELVGDEGKVYSIPDSGVFLNFKTHTGNSHIEKLIYNIYKVANTKESTPIPQCNAAYPGEEWKCLFIENSYPMTKGKFMIINSEYDSWAIFNILGFDCLKSAQAGGATLSHCSKTEMAYIEKYRTEYRETLAKFLGLNQ